MATLKEKIFYIKNGFKNGSTAIDGQSSLFFLNDIINELSSDPINLKDFKEDIPSLYNSCIEELKISPQETKMILLKSVMKGSGIDSTLKEDLITKTPIFKDFLESKEPSEIYKDVDTLFNFAVDEKNKIIEIDSLISIADITLNKNSNGSILSTYVENDNFNKDKITKVLAASIVLKEFNDESSYDLTENQKQLLEGIVIKVNNNKSKDKEFYETLDEETEHYRKFMFFNSLDSESQLHELKNGEELNGSGGFISSHPIEESLSDTLKNKAEREDLDISGIDWEKKYSDYLKSLNNVKVMSSMDKFQSRFASHGFAPKTASLFGDSVVMMDKYGTPQRTLWNVSGLTGTMRLSRDVDYSDPAVAEQTFVIAALNARRNNWPTVYLNHPGPDQEAKRFLELSIAAMVEVGNYDFDDIKVPRKFKHVLDHIKNTYTFIEDGRKLDNVEQSLDNVEQSLDNNVSDLSIPLENYENKKIVDIKNEEVFDIPNEDVQEDLKDIGTDLSGFDSDNTIFANDDIEFDNSEYIGNEDYEAPIDDIDLSGVDFGSPEDHQVDYGELNLDSSTKDLFGERKIPKDSADKPTKKIKLFKNI